MILILSPLLPAAFLVIRRQLSTPEIERLEHPLFQSNAHGHPSTDDSAFSNFGLLISVVLQPIPLNVSSVRLYHVCLNDVSVQEINNKRTDHASQPTSLQHMTECGTHKRPKSPFAIVNQDQTGTRKRPPWNTEHPYLPLKVLREIITLLAKPRFTVAVFTGYRTAVSIN